jgi:hypothetical protein
VSVRIEEYTGNRTAPDVRAWAQEQGLTVGARGALPAQVVQAYAKAHRLRRKPAKAAA